MLNIILVGTGKTGRVIERLAESEGHTVVARFNSSSPLLNQDDYGVFDDCDAVIDFSRPDLALSHIKKYCDLNVQAVMGTTGWYDQLEEVRSWVEAGNIALLYAPNFSIGVAVLSRVLEKAAQLMDKLPAYDPAVHEAHHRFKLDSPSGTAIHLANILLDNIDRKKQIAPETQHKQIPASDLHITSQRLGHIFGQHSIIFDSPFDQITLSHVAKNRDGFAFGAIRAAEWIAGKKGLFTLDNLLNDWLED